VIATPDLPVGQHALDVFPRWGLPRFIRLRPHRPEHPKLRLEGDVFHSQDVELQSLDGVTRREQVSDLHCVTTWTRRGLRWSGFAFRDLYEHFVVPRVRPRAEVRFVIFRGLDGYHCHLPLEDALAADVLLADRLDDEPLSFAHGAPLRLVAPAHYGYKSAKHLCALELRTDPVAPPTQDWREHPRGRVAFEERGRVLPGFAYRCVYRAFLPLMLRAYLRQPAPRGDVQRRG
jgi:DMSO/TMAO reductase YedYZ molybdopterin-dependent catalytic subunit